jgi:hypothetical protein
MGDGSDVVTDQASEAANRVNQGLVVGGAVLVGLGGLLGFAGMLLVTSAVAAAARRWMRQLERPPSDIAKRKWQQARAATSAGTQAWRSGSPAQPPASS